MDQTPNMISSASMMQNLSRTEQKKMDGGTLLVFGTIGFFVLITIVGIVLSVKKSSSSGPPPPSGSNNNPPPQRQLQLISSNEMMGLEKRRDGGGLISPYNSINEAYT